MSGNRQFVDTNILVYAHDVTAIEIHRRTGASFWDAMILRSAQERKGMAATWADARVLAVPTVPRRSAG